MDDRREFLQKAVGVLAGAAVVFKSAVAAAKKLGLPLSKVPTVKKVGGSATVKIGGKPVLLIRDSDTSVRALSALCTHQECPLSYNANKKKIECGCHGSAFDLNGKVLVGPAKKDIKSYEAVLSGDQIVLKV